VEAPQGVQLTGTNRPRTYHKHANRIHCAAPGARAHHTRRVTSNPTQLHTSYGGHSGGETPGPIPNPEAKPSSADGTAPARVWESRTPPNTTPPQGPPTTPRGPLSSAIDERICDRVSRRKSDSRRGSEWWRGSDGDDAWPYRRPTQGKAGELATSCRQ
jgi:hypothetical protein